MATVGGTDENLEFQFKSACEFRDTLRALVKGAKKLVDVVQAANAETAAFGALMEKAAGLLLGATGASALQHYAAALRGAATCGGEFARAFGEAFAGPLRAHADFGFTELCDAARRADAAAAAAKEKAQGKRRDDARREWAAAAETLRCRLRETAAARREHRFLSAALNALRAHAEAAATTDRLFGGVRAQLPALDAALAAVPRAADEPLVQGFLAEKTLLGWSARAFWSLRTHALLCFRDRKGVSPPEEVVQAASMLWARGGAGDAAAKVTAAEADCCFELGCGKRAGSAGKTLLFMASSPSEATAWVAALAETISRESMSQGTTVIKPALSVFPSAATASTSSTTTTTAAASAPWEAVLRAVPGNTNCCDCASTEPPEWANLALGTLICSRCAEAHRSLGLWTNSVQAPRKLSSPELSDPVTVAFIKQRGNAAIARLFEHNNPAPRPSADASLDDRVSYLASKYRDRRWIPPSSVGAAALGKVLIAACSRDPPPPLEAIASLICAGAPINAKDEQHSQTALHKAAQNGSLLLLEMLVRAGADVSAADSRGWTPLHYAAFFNRPRCVARLIFHGASRQDPDPNGVDARTAAAWNLCTEATISLLGNRLTEVPSLTLADAEADKVCEVLPIKLSVPANKELPPDTRVMLSAKIFEMPVLPTPSTTAALSSPGSSRSSSPVPPDSQQQQQQQQQQQRRMSRASSLSVSTPRDPTPWELAKERHRNTFVLRKRVAKLRGIPRWVPVSASVASFVLSAPRTPRMPLVGAQRRSTIAVPGYKVPAVGLNLSLVSTVASSSSPSSSPRSRVHAPPLSAHSASSSPVAPQRGSGEERFTRHTSVRTIAPPPPRSPLSTQLSSPPAPSTSPPFVPALPTCLTTPPIRPSKHTTPPPPPPSVQTPTPPLPPIPPPPTPPPPPTIPEQLSSKIPPAVKAVASIGEQTRRCRTQEEGLQSVRLLRQLLHNVEPAQRLLKLPTRPAPSPSEDKLVMIRNIATSAETIICDVLRGMLAAVSADNSRVQASELETFLSCVDQCTTNLKAANRL